MHHAGFLTPHRVLHNVVGTCDSCGRKDTTIYLAERHSSAEVVTKRRRWCASCIRKLIDHQTPK